MLFAFMTQSVFMWQNIISPHNQKSKCQQGQQATGPSPVMALQAFSSLLACGDLPVFIAALQFKKLPMNRRVLFSGNLCQEVFGN